MIVINETVVYVHAIAIDDVVNCTYKFLISPSYKRDFIPFLDEGDILVILRILSKG